MSIHLFSTFLGGRPILFPQKNPLDFDDEVVWRKLIIFFWDPLIFACIGHAPLWWEFLHDAKTSKTFQNPIPDAFASCVFNENSNHLEFRVKTQMKTQELTEMSLVAILHPGGFMTCTKEGCAWRTTLSTGNPAGTIRRPTVDQMASFLQVWFTFSVGKYYPSKYLLDLIFQFFSPRNQTQKIQFCKNGS